MRGIPNAPERVWDFIAVTDGCWEWRGRTDSYGYGVLSLGGRNRKAHRVVWEIHHGRPAPANRLVCHRCNNRRCCNPEHLYLGTPAQNTADRIAVGTTTGSRNGNSYLFEPHVIEIKGWLAVGINPAHLATRFGVSKATIYAIRNGTNWSQVAA